MSDSARDTARTTPLPDLLALRHREGQRVHFQVPADWLQGRTTFGGLLSLLAVQAMRDVWQRLAFACLCKTNFVGPVNVGSFQADITLLRQGKNVRQVQCRITQIDEQGAEQVGGVLLGVFGTGATAPYPP